VASRAVVIGPDEYAPDSGIASHPEIGNSARMYGEILAGDRRWGADRVEVLPDDRLSSINDVMGVVQEAADQAEPGDTLLVIYVGHGAFWDDVPGAQVHFAVGSSRRRQPHTWMSSWYVYRAIRNSSASLKVLIVDCCYSNLLPQLGGEDGALRGALGEIHEGTCVLTAIKNNVNEASAIGCRQLPTDLAACTPFSGHLLNILRQGTRDQNDELTLGLIHDAIDRDMRGCGTVHDLPRMILNDAREGVPLFTNHMAPTRRERSRSVPASAAEWFETIMREGDYELDQLLADPGKAGQVVALLDKEPDEAVQRIASRVNYRAIRHYSQPALFARYWAEARPARPA
jgi:hypothetical protein